MKYFSTFSGIGGFEIGIHNAYRNKVAGKEATQEAGDSASRFNPARATKRFARKYYYRIFGPKEPVCVGYSEINKPAISVYEHKFKGVPNYGDITKIKAEDLPDFELLVGGFPCQAFSIAGKRAGFEDTRGTLFFDLARILRAKRPRLFVFENVKGLLSHDSGKTFATIIATIDELGYDAQWQVINSKNHGVPQNRERIYIVGHLRGTPRPEVFPLGQYDNQDSRLSGHTSNTLTARYEGAQAVGTYVLESELDAQGIKQLNKPVHSNDRIYAPDGISPTLNTMQGGNRQPFVALSRNEADPSSPTHANRVREASGIPRQLDGARSVSDTQRYKMAGNAVTTNAVQAIFERIFA